jgi:hypothetical protein
MNENILIKATSNMMLLCCHETDVYTAGGLCVITPPQDGITVGETNLVSQVGEPGSGQRFCEDVCRLIFGGNV